MSSAKPSLIEFLDRHPYAGGMTVVQFAVWRAGAVYAPVNNRFTAGEVAGLAAEAGLALLVGTPDDLAPHARFAGSGTVSYEWETGKAVGDGSGRSAKREFYAPDVAVISRRPAPPAGPRRPVGVFSDSASTTA